MINPVDIMRLFDTHTDNVGTVSFPVAQKEDFITQAYKSIFMDIVRPLNVRAKAERVNAYYETSIPISALFSDLYAELTGSVAGATIVTPDDMFIVNYVSIEVNGEYKPARWATHGELMKQIGSALFSPTDCDMAYTISGRSIKVYPAQDGSAYNVSILKSPPHFDSSSSEYPMHPSLTSQVVVAAAKLANASILENTGVRLNEEIENG